MRLIVGWLALLATVWFAPAASAATGTCGPATGQGTGPADYPTYCWIDFSNYSDTAAVSGQPFTITLPGGSTLSFTLTVSTGGIAGTGGLKATTVPTWTGAAFGQTAFTGVPGNPALYQTNNGTTTNVTLSNIVLTVGSGTVPYAIVAADAESTNNGESLSFTTNGNPWTLLASMPQGGTYPTLGGVGTTTVTETGVAGTVGAYAFATQGSPTTISSVLGGGGLQGIAFAVKFHAVDFAITKSHVGNFNAGGTGSYTLTVTSNGPDTYSPTDTVTVTDTLPTGLTYASASGSGWVCGDVGQVVTCTATNITIASGGSLPAITLNVNVLYTAPTSVTNTATVASNPNLDFNTANNTATDVTTIVDPDLSTSTKTVVVNGGGNAVVGSTLQYTVTLTESAGVAASNASVTDNIPANVSNFTVVSIPAGATDSSTAAGTGTNNDGFLDVTGIAVPANGSATVVFTVQVAAGTVNCTAIDNTATVTNPYGNGATPTAPTLTVAQSSCGGSKVLYVYDNTTAGMNAALSRTPQPANTGTAITVAANGSQDFTLTPALARALNFANKPDAGNVSVSVTLVERATGTATGTARPTTVELRTAAGVSIATSGNVNVVGAGTTAYAYTITVPQDTQVAAGQQLVLRLHNNSGTHTIAFSQKTAGQGASTMSFNVSTVISVDSVEPYSAAYPATTTTGVYVPGTTVYLCAVISDPFGSYDIDPATGGTIPKITLTDPNSVVQVNAAAMTKEGATDCGGTANSADETFEYAYAIPAAAATGNWTASVTGYEGTEGTVTHTASGPFDVNFLPALLIMKSVSVVSDPTADAIKHSIPGAVMAYTLLIQNNGKGPVDSGALLITDAIPTTTPFYVTSATPYTFAAGTSGLTGVTVTYSNNNGASYTYTPVICSPYPCTDSNITNIKAVFTGSMAGKTGATAPSLTFLFETKVP